MDSYYDRYDDFLGIGVPAYLASVTQTYRERIVHEPEHYLLSVDETMYVRALGHEYRVNIPYLNFAGTVTTTEFRYQSGVPVQVTAYHIPYSGKKSPLQCLRIPVAAHVHVSLTSHFLTIAIERNPRIDAIEGCIDRIRNQMDEMTAATMRFNDTLEECIRAFVVSQKRLLLGEQQRLTAWHIEIQDRITGAEAPREPVPQDTQPIPHAS